MIKIMYKFNVESRRDRDWHCMRWFYRVKKLHNKSSLELRGAKVECMDRVTEETW